MPTPLHTHAPPPHQHRNANSVHKEELAKAGLVDQIVNWVNDKTATVEGIILFIAIGVASLIGYLTHNTVLALTFGALSSYLLQLVYLALLMYAGKKSDRARQIQSDEIYHFSENTAHHMGENMHHLDSQDAELLKQTNLLIEIQQGYQEQLTALTVKVDAQAAILTQLLAALPKKPGRKPATTLATAMEQGERDTGVLNAMLTKEDVIATIKEHEDDTFRKARRADYGRGLRAGN